MRIIPSTKSTVQTVEFYNDLQICNNVGVYKNGSGKGLFDDENEWLNSLQGNYANSHIELSKNSILLYPNPASTQVTIKYNIADHSTAHLLLYDVIGNMVKDITLSGKTQYVVFDVSDLIPSIYTYKYLVDGEYVSAGKLIIQ